MPKRERATVVATPGSVMATPASADYRRIWPRQSYLEFGALASAVPCARLHAKQLMWEWHLSHLAAPVEQVLCELVTNAIRVSACLTGSSFAGSWAADTPPVRLWIYASNAAVLIQIWDADDRQPVRRNPGLDADGGRGLLIVEAFSADWGWYTPRRSSGKVVWALIQAGTPTHDDRRESRRSA